MFNAKYKAFTLIEMVIVIVVLAIITSITMISFSNFTVSSRDSSRISDISNISKGLNLFFVNSGIYPKPEDSVQILSGVTLGYQGNVGTDTIKLLKLSSNLWKDPSDNVYYTYNTNVSGTKFQLMALLEKESTTNMNGYIPENIDEVSATSYISRFPFLKGDKLGTILILTGANDNEYIPIQDLKADYNLGESNPLAKIVYDNSDSADLNLTAMAYSNYTDGGKTIILDTTEKFNLSGNFGEFASGATISGCSNIVTASSTGSFSFASISSGTVCNNITAERTGYTCSTTNDGPSTLSGNVTDIVGSCTFN